MNLRFRIATFRSLQCDICEGVRIVPKFLDVPTLRRNKFRVPVHGHKAREISKEGFLHEPIRKNGREALLRSPFQNGFSVSIRVQSLEVFLSLQ